MPDRRPRIITPNHRCREYPRRILHRRVEPDENGAARALKGWARAERFNIMFEVRKVRELDVLYVLLRPQSQLA